MNQKFDIEKIKLEYLYLIISIFFGLAMIFINPPFHANDEDRHFYKAWYLTQGNLKGFTKDSVKGGYLPVSLIKSIEYAQYFKFSDSLKLNYSKMWAQTSIPLRPDSIEFKSSPTTKHFGLSYFPHAIGVGLGRILKVSPLWIGWLARIFGLLFFSYFIFLLIKLIPIFKYAFFMVALTPTVLYQVSSVTYDMMMILCCFSLFAYTIYKINEGSQFGLKDYLLVGFILGFMTLIKTGYGFVPFVLLLIPRKQFKNSLHYIISIVFVILAIIIPDLLWDLTQKNYDNVLRLQTDFITSYKKQLSFTNEDIWFSIKNFINNILMLKFELFKGLTAKFGYSYTVVDTPWYYIQGLALISVGYLDSDTKFRFPAWSKFIILSILILNFLMIVVGFYLYMTPVGALAIFGVQGRYFAPFLPLLLLLFYNNFKKFKWWEENKNKIVVTYTLISLIYIILFLRNHYYY